MSMNAKTQQVLEERVERQRVALFQAQAIVQTVVAAMRPGDWPAGEPGLPYALRAADEMLGRVTEQLDAALLFDLSGGEQGAQP